MNKFDGIRLNTHIADELDEALAGYTETQRAVMLKMSKWHEESGPFITGIYPYESNVLKWWQKILQFLHIKKYHRPYGAVMVFGTGGGFEPDDDSGPTAGNQPISIKINHKKI